MAQPLTLYRHGVFTRLWHWVNFICMVVLLMSGLQIFNAHPSLYWGADSNFDDAALSIYAIRRADGQAVGITRIGPYKFETTGVLGLSRVDGQLVPRAFPAWATVPSIQWLAMGRHWHFFFAWIFGPLLFAFLAYSIISGHFWRDLVPRRQQWRHFGTTVADHLRLRFDRGKRARHYNILQKLSYLLVLFGLAPVIVLTGLTMSPFMAATWPWLLDLFGGRQSARTIHFICAFSLVAFFVVHVLLVLLSGVFNNMRGMITGRYTLPGNKDDQDV